LSRHKVRQGKSLTLLFHVAAWHARLVHHSRGRKRSSVLPSLILGKSKLVDDENDEIVHVHLYNSMIARFVAWDVQPVANKVPCRDGETKSRPFRAIGCEEGAKTALYHIRRDRGWATSVYW
jgi:hypothetical protein